jgi:LCP family protein required for cell wall assembly
MKEPPSRRLQANQPAKKRERLLWLVYLGLLGSGIFFAFYTPPQRQHSPAENSSAPTIQPGAGVFSSPADLPLNLRTNPFTPCPRGSCGSDSISTPTPTVILPAPNPWNGKSRVTLLVMGLDYADWEDSDRVGPPRSDTLILLTIDPLSKTAGMLSIPRDLWVSMPGIQGEHKLNTAHRFGELYALPGGGPGLTMRTIENLLEVPVNFYARLDFRSFETFIDEIGGVELDVPAQIKVDPIGPGNTVVLEPGRQRLAGPIVLAYARSRSTEGEDFDRSTRQQQVILAIRQRVLDLGNLPRLVARAPALYQQLSAGIQTNLTLEQVIQLAWLSADVPAENIQRLAISPADLTYATAPDGQAIYLPIPDRIRTLRNTLFTSASLPGQPMTADELVAAENTQVTLVNESGDTALGTLTARFLAENGLDAVEVVQSKKVRPLTRLVDNISNPYTLRRLIDLLHVAPSEIYLSLDMTAGAEMVIYLGEDWASENPLGQ